MPWVIATYLPVALFSLRPSHTTASGGKTLLVPTAFAIKMALLGASLQLAGETEGQQRFPLIHALRIAVALPEHLIVSKTQIRRWRPRKLSSASTQEQEIATARDRGSYPLLSTLAAHECLHFGGPLQIALTLDAQEPPAWLEETLVAINYLGTRGSFLQILDWPERQASLDSRFSEITRASDVFAIDGTPQLLDDWGEAMTFDHANTYSNTPIRLGIERIQHQVVLPYQLVQSGRSYSQYRWIAPP